MAGKGVAKDVAEVVPDATGVEGVGKVGLGLASVEAVALLGDLEGATTSLGVPGVLLSVLATVGREDVGVGDGATNRPEADFVVAVVDDAGVTDGCDGGGEGAGQGEDAELLEHFGRRKEAA